MPRWKRFALRISVFLGVLAVSFVCLGCHIFRIDYLFARYDAGANIQVWLDENANGEREPEEPPLEGVCVWAGYAALTSEAYPYAGFSNWEEICARPGSLTDENGNRWRFFAGGSCDEVHILLGPLDGYRATTPVAVNGCTAEFGLVADISPSEARSFSAEDYIRRQIRLEQVKRIAVPIAAVALASVASVLLVRPKRDGRVGLGWPWSKDGEKTR